MPSNILARQGRISGVLCCWSAAAQFGLSNSYDNNWSYYANVSSVVKSMPFTIFPFPNEPLQTTQKGKYTLTTPLQTVVDLVRWDCEVEFVLQALERWETWKGNLDEVWHELNRLNLMQKYREDYEPYRNEWTDVI